MIAPLVGADENCIFDLYEKHSFIKNIKRTLGIAG